MYKAKLVAGIILISTLVVWPSTARAGTYFFGAKGWYTTWDSGILDWIEEDIAKSFRENRLDFKAHKDPTTGYLAGPLLGYQSSDGKWSLGLAFMMLSSLGQDWEGNAGTMELRGDIELKRYDIELAVDYSLSKYFKIYGGYRYQDMDLDFILDFGTAMGTQTDRFHIDLQEHIPTIGLGVVYPLLEQIAVGGQAGLLYGIMNMELKDPNGDTENIWPHPGLGFNTEANITFMPGKNHSYQLGYRYQVFAMYETKWITDIILTSKFATQLPSFKGGTYFLGAKGWYTTWDSGILDWLEKDIAVSFRENRLDFKAHKDPGTGYLAGPLLGYQSDDGKWSLSLAPMVFSSFEQDREGSAETMELRGDVGLKRYEIDLALNYTLSKYSKIYVGYKYQDMDLDFILEFETTMGKQTEKFSVDSQAHIPTVGLGTVYPLHERIVIGGQAGLLYAIMNMKLEDSKGDTENIWPHPGPGFNTEASITWMPWKKLIFQAGYRYQVFTIEARGPGKEDITKSYDITHGSTVSLVLTF